jgi:hypothetical protein
LGLKGPCILARWSQVAQKLSGSATPPVALPLLSRDCGTFVGTGTGTHIKQRRREFDSTGTHTSYNKSSNFDHKFI